MSVAISARAARLAELLRDAERAVVLTGAGVSVPSGIPDFRTPRTGLWENVDPMEVAHIDAWRRDPDRFWRFYSDRFASLVDKRPNPAHEALAELERRGLIDGVITQNIDRLHRRAGSADVVEVHGSVERSVCLSCPGEQTLEATLERLHADPDGIPRCDCGAPLKPGVVLFGEWLPEGALERAHQLAARADLLLCIGSSLEVQPVAQLPSVTRMNGGQVAILTQGPTPYDRRVAVKRSGDVVAELQALLAALGL